MEGLEHVSPLLGSFIEVFGVKAAVYIYWGLLIALSILVVPFPGKTNRDVELPVDDGQATVADDRTCDGSTYCANLTNQRSTRPSLNSTRTSKP